MRSKARRGHQLVYSVGWKLGERERRALARVPPQAWQAAIDGRGEVRERRTADACPDSGCAHPRCWIGEAHVTELALGRCHRHRLGPDHRPAASP